VLLKNNLKVCLLWGRPKARIGVDPLDLTLAHNDVSVSVDLEVLVELSAIASLQAMHRPHDLIDTSVRELDHLKNLSARVICRKRAMILGVPVSSEYDQVKGWQLFESVDQGDD